MIIGEKMGKYRKIGGLIFRRTAHGLKYAGTKTVHGVKYAHGRYKSYKAGETSRLREKSEKERLKAQIRGYKRRYKNKTNYSKHLRELKSLFK